MDYFSTFVSMLCARKLSDNTIRSYSTYIKPYLHFLASLDILPEDASWQVMRNYLDFLQADRGLSDRTINMVISYLQFFHMYVLHKDWDKTQLPFRVFDTYLPYVPSPKEVHRLLQAMDNPKMKLATSILYSTGMRLDELCYLKCSDISHSSMKIHIRRSKNHSDRYVPLTESIWNMILQYWYSFPPDKRPRDWLLQTLHSRPGLTLPWISSGSRRSFWISGVPLAWTAVSQHIPSAMLTRPDATRMGWIY